MDSRASTLFILVNPNVKYQSLKGKLLAGHWHLNLGCIIGCNITEVELLNWQTGQQCNIGNISLCVIQDKYFCILYF
jgi:hypothetical protein